VGPVRQFRDGGQAVASTTREAQANTSELVQAALDGDIGSRERLVERYVTLVWSTVRSYRLGHADAHDAAQNTWLRLFEQLGSVRDAERLPGWLATTASRECLRILHRGGREVIGVDTHLLDRADDAAPSPERAAIDRTMADLLWAHVADMPPPVRTMLCTLTAPNAPRYADFAQATGMPLGSVGPTRMRYLRQLRARLEASGLDARSWR
jgi:RNA polymerase sigma factor (sigma-70 family)